MLEVGEKIDKYRLLQLLGQGGMGAVYAAENTTIGKKVAIKVLHPAFADHEGALQRFLLEARTAAAVEHPGIVEIFDFGWAEVHGQRSPYLVMELLRGRALSDQLVDGEPLDLELTMEVALEVLSVLVAVHNKDIVHRDLKPENIFLAIDRSGSRRVKILDFGISKVKTEKGGGLTLTGTVLGTPYYMSPEQAHGAKDIDHRVDIWAMGAILYLLTTGQVPFTGDSYNEILAKIVSRSFTPPSAIQPSIPQWLEAVVLKAMAWERDDRYRSAGDFLGDLRARWEHAASGSGGTTPGIPPPAGAAKPPAPAPEPMSHTAQGQPPAPTTASVQDSVPTVASQSEPPPERAGQGAVSSEPTKGSDRVPALDSMSVTAAAPEMSVSSDSILATRAASRPPDWAVGAARLARTPDSLDATVHPLEPDQGETRRSRIVLALGVGVTLLALVLIGGAIALWSALEQSKARRESVEQPGPSVASVAPATNEATDTSAIEAPPVPVQPIEGASVEVIAEPGSADHETSDKGARNGRAKAPNVKQAPLAGAPPAPTPAPIKALSREEVSAGIRGISVPIQRCLSQSGQPPPYVTVRVQIDGAGAALFQSADPAPPAVVAACLQRAVAGASFRATGAPPRLVTHAVKTAKAATPASSPSTEEGKTKRLKGNPFGN